jgi:hypothetical protein
MDNVPILNRVVATLEPQQTLVPGCSEAARGDQVSRRYDLGTYEAALHIRMNARGGIERGLPSAQGPSPYNARTRGGEECNQV